MSQSPLEAQGAPSREGYLGAFNQLALKIRNGESFSGRERNCFFLNTGGLRFADASGAAALDLPDDGRGSAALDWDGDGDLDLIVTNRSAPRVRFLRNDSAGGGWLAVRLEGDPARGCTRDAIGAVVELRGGGQQMMRLLAAGDGFLSQGSKVLFFGTGGMERVEELAVRWPGGERELFTGATVRGRWRLQQGRGVAVAEPVERITLADGAPVLPESGETMRIRLSQPLQIDGMKYTNLAGSIESLDALMKDGPVLVNLWAQWCAPCAQELAEFSSLAGKVTVVALNVEGMEPGTQVTAEDAAAFLKSRDYTGRAGMADAALTGQLDALVREAVYRHGRLPVPAGFLFAKGGWLTVIYKGAVSAQTILADAATLGTPEEEARRLAVPLPGTWARAHFITHPPALAMAWRESGQPEQGLKVLTEYAHEHAVPQGAPQARQLAEVYQRMGELKLELKDAPGALAAFRDGLRVQPDSLSARVGEVRALAAAQQDAELAAAVAAMADSPAGPDALLVRAERAMVAGRWSESLADTQAAVRRNPRFIPGLNLLARLRAAAPETAVRDGAEALRTAEFFLQAPGARQNAEFLLTLAMAQAEGGDFTAAASSVESALRAGRQRGDREFLRRAAPVAEAIRGGRAWRLP